MLLLVANEVADAGRILINGKVAKASQAVNAGDIIEVTFGNRPIKVKVLSDVEPRTKDVAREMYEIIEQDNVLAAAHDAPKAE
jgi:ribosomal 50S subunit-recycling heat shock protein